MVLFVKDRSLVCLKIVLLGAVLAYPGWPDSENTLTLASKNRGCGGLPRKLSRDGATYWHSSFAQYLLVVSWVG